MDTLTIPVATAIVSIIGNAASIDLNTHQNMGQRETFLGCPYLFITAGYNGHLGILDVIGLEEQARAVTGCMLSYKAIVSRHPS